MNHIATTKIPIIVSALVCPGIGQFIQRRWLAGSFYLIGFGYGFVMVILRFIKIMTAYYSCAFKFDGTESIEPVSFVIMIFPLIIAGIFYILNLFDVTAAFHRFASAEREEKFARQLSAILETSTAKQNEPAKPNEPPTPPDIPKTE